ncbi:MAG: hypothetical protein JWQ58_2355 [Reyranella sp.]|nr:hypothetical protein [Reyranella sp.]
MSGTPHSTLSHRIHRFVAVFERYKRRPDRREALHVLSAIDCLREGSYEEGEQAIVAAEQAFARAATRYRIQGESESGPTSDGAGVPDSVSARDLRTALRSVIQGKSEQAAAPLSGQD